MHVHIHRPLLELERPATSFRNLEVARKWRVAIVTVTRVTHTTPLRSTSKLRKGNLSSSSSWRSRIAQNVLLLRENFEKTRETTGRSIRQSFSLPHQPLRSPTTSTLSRNFCARRERLVRSPRVRLFRLSLDNVLLLRERADPQRASCRLSLSHPREISDGSDGRRNPLLSGFLSATISPTCLTKGRALADVASSRRTIAGRPTKRKTIEA